MSDLTEEQYIAALTELDRRLDAMPKHCPSWCIGDHREAVEEGNSIEASSLHKSVDFADHLGELRSYASERVTRRALSGGWQAQLLQEHRPGYGMPSFVEVTVDDGDTSPSARIALSLTTGEARSMAAALIRLADLEELS